MVTVACGNASGASEDTVTVTETATITTTETIAPDTTESPTEDLDQDQDQDQDQESDGPSVTATEIAVSGSLNLELAQRVNGEWAEGRYEIADQSNVLGLGVPVSACGQNNDSSELEFRLGNRFDELILNFGQANTSDDSDQFLSLSVVANNEQVEIQTVPFNEYQTVPVSVTGVNALRLRFFRDESICRNQGYGQVTGVLYDIAIR